MRSSLMSDDIRGYSGNLLPLHHFLTEPRGAETCAFRANLSKLCLMSDQTREIESILGDSSSGLIITFM